MRRGALASSPGAGAGRRRRIWCEHLPAEELGSPAAVRLLRRFELEPLVAIPPAAEGPALARALAALSGVGLRIGIWPLLADEDGYWPSGENADPFCRRARETLAFAEQAGARVATVAVDLEPPLPLTRALLSRDLRSRTRATVDLLRGLARRPAHEPAAVERYSALRRELAGRGIETLAAATPAVAIDLASGTELFERLLGTPILAPAWDAVSAMAYTSMMASAFPGRGELAARAALYEVGRLLAGASAAGAPRASLSIGLVGSGKLGDEKVYAGPGELERDVAAAHAAGVGDLALFSLEGVLGRGNPEEWLERFTRPPRAVAVRPADRAARAAARAATSLLATLARVSRIGR